MPTQLGVCYKNGDFYLCTLEDPVRHESLSLKDKKQVKKVSLYVFLACKTLTIGSFALWAHFYAVPITVLHTHRSSKGKLLVKKVAIKQK